MDTITMDTITTITMATPMLIRSLSPVCSAMAQDGKGMVIYYGAKLIRTSMRVGYNTVVNRIQRTT